MPRRNLFWLIVVAGVSLVCYHAVPGSRYSRALADVFDHVSRRYFQPIGGAELFQGAMQGLRERLDDNSAYIPPSKQQAFEEDLGRQFGGVGLSVSLDPATKQLTVLSPLPDSPACQAGIRQGDWILKIDGHSTQDMPLADAVTRMHGKVDAPVTLTILHAGAAEPVELTLVRKVIQVPTVEGDTRNPDGGWNFFLPGRDRIGYVRVLGFVDPETVEPTGDKTKNTVADLKKALLELTRGKMRGLVLDLRDDPGGSLKAAVEVCDLFIPNGLIVTTRGRDGKILQAFQATGAAPFTDFPMAVLVNQYSASASEIVAACLQDHHRAVVVGQRSFGKGTVQEVTDLGDALGELKLTIATYWRPSGRNIHHARDDAKDATWGVLPDPGYNVPVSDDALARFQRWRQDRDNAWLADGKSAAPHPGGQKAERFQDFIDRPLAKAVEYLEKTAPQGESGE
jgi:carboxyl-terminal processing protease